MPFFAILAAATSRSRAIDFVPMDRIWGQITALTWLQAVLAVMFGVTFLLYGWRIYKMLVIIAFGLIGLGVGLHFGPQLGSKIWTGTAGLIIFVSLSIPFMKWAVSILGAIAGGILTGSLWYAAGLPEQYILAGAAIGLVAGGMISFIVFKIAVMLFTSLEGSILIAAGVLSLLNQYQNLHKPADETIKDLVFHHNWFMPVMLLVPIITGFIVQRFLIKHSSDWNI
jgi:hypothetical protein